jgi:hypothetical protein
MSTIICIQSEKLRDYNDLMKYDSAENGMFSTERIIKFQEYQGQKIGQGRLAVQTCNLDEESQLVGIHLHWTKGDKTLVSICEVEPGFSRHIIPKSQVIKNHQEYVKEKELISQ